MSDLSRVASKVVVWEQARQGDTPLTPEEVCHDAPELLPAFRAALAHLYPCLNDTGPRTASDIDEETTRYAQPDPPLPAAIGEYKVLKELGRGGMGRVYEAEDPHLRRRVAIKVMKPELAIDPTARERFLREARAQAAVQNDHVAVIHDVKQAADGTPFLVLPLLRGETLAARLAREGGRPLPAPELIRVGRQVADGLAAAHARGLVHRDVKPSNIWLTAADGKARVLDFGLARAVEADGDDPTVTPDGSAGPITPAYGAPEQAAGRAVDARADLFSLGAVLFELATGRRAFPGETVIEVLAAVATHTPPLAHVVNPDVPEPLSNLIAGLMAKEPPARTPDSAAGVATVLRQLEQGGKTKPTPIDGGGPFVAGTEAVVATSARLLPKSWRSCVVVAGITVGVLLAAWAVVWFVNRPHGVGQGTMTSDGPPPNNRPTPPEGYTGRVDVRVERTVDGRPKFLGLNDPGALPLRKDDKFRVEGVVEPAAYLYVLWVDPGHDVTPVYPWDAEKGWGSRPAEEKQVSRVSLPGNVADRYTAPDAKSGVATIVQFVTPAPLTVPDDQLRKWFEALPDLPLPQGEETGRVWFDNYAEAKEPLRSRTFHVVRADDPFARWQGELQRSLGPVAAFQTAVSFARVERK